MINLKSPLDLAAALPMLLPKAIAWAEEQEQHIRAKGRALSGAEVRIARAVEVEHPERIRIATVSEIPMPDDPALRAAALQAELFGPHTDGLTLGYGIYLAGGRMSRRLLAHECRHVQQFPSMARAHEWYRSPEYAEALKLRRIALRRRLIFIEGVPASGREDSGGRRAVPNLRSQIAISKPRIPRRSAGT